MSMLGIFMDSRRTQGSAYSYRTCLFLAGQAPQPLFIRVFPRIGTPLGISCTIDSLAVQKVISAMKTGSEMSQP
jgi:hypothetical protein